ncbi:MAG: Survival protein SurA precursor (Peptidyl-prolyl cis-trans isomerase SurA) [Ignavibacteriae bacterium]|nr:MAG: Survival protein SurA precursor (Peptidyl-prolyl cis-trans isomerase SurA) [Ignavibacteriota bacterium]
MYKSHLIILSILFLFLIGCSPKYSELVVAKIGDNQLKLGEYEKFYIKNTGSYDIAKNSSRKEREDFLELLVKYRLKLQDAYDKNLLSDPEIIEELKDYRASLASTYLLDKDLVEPSLKKIYNRMKEEIRASHILIRVDQNASPEDTLKAYTKAMELIERINKGEDFGNLAYEYSEDPSAKQNRGDIYYFTTGQLIPQFEDAVYEMKVGEVTQKPIRTSFGYHVVKVTDRGPAKGSVRVRHIMVRFNSSQPDSADSAAAYGRIMAIQESLKLGADFAQLAKKHSEDGGSATNGGDLGFFQRRRWIQSFDEAAFKLKPGEISPIVRTPYGFHIIKCDSIKPVPSYEELKPEIQRTFQSQRYNDAYNAYIENLKKKIGYTFYENVFENFVSLLDSTDTTTDSSWDSSVTEDVRNAIILQVGTRNVDVDYVIKTLSTRPDFRDIYLKKSELLKRVSKIGEIVLLEEASKDLEKQYPEFLNLMKEYQDGVVLYKAEQMEVWDKLSINDSSMREFFNNNREKFMHPDRVNYSEIYVMSDTLAEKIYNELINGANFEELAEKYNEEPELKQNKGAHGFVSVDESELAEIAWEMEIDQISKPIYTQEGGYSIIKVNAKEESREKSFEEAGIELSNAFQEYEQKRLEGEWLERIKQKYPVQKFPDVLEKAFLEPPSK